MLRLLIVEDETRTREGLKKCIPWETFGIGQIAEADDGSTALELVSSYKPDIILSDIKMPNMTGIDFVKRIIQDLPQCKIIFISGYCDKESLKAAIQLKAIRYIEKPVNIKELKEAVRVAIEEYRSGQDLLRQQTDTASKLENSIELIRQDIAVMLADKNTDSGRIQSSISISGLDMPPEGEYVTVLFRIGPSPDSSPEHRNELRKKLLESVRLVFINEDVPCITGVKDEEHVMVHIHLKAALTRERVKTVSERTLFKFNELCGLKTPLPVFIGIGERVKGLKSLYASYQTAFSAVRKLFFLGNAGILIYKNTPDAAQVSEEDVEKEFAQYLAGYDHAVFEWIQKKTELIRKQDATEIDPVKTLFYKLMLVLYEEAGNKNLSGYLADRKKEFLWLKVSNALTLNELHTFLTQELREYFQVVEQLHSKSRVVFEAIQFIRKNYMVGTLSINDISRELNVAPTYLCKIFKRDTAATINDYINEYRIEKAKELLLDRNTKLYEIASRSGYNDSKYFSKMFKRLTGVTPSEFRGI